MPQAPRPAEGPAVAMTNLHEEYPPGGSPPNVEEVAIEPSEATIQQQTADKKVDIC